MDTLRTVLLNLVVPGLTALLLAGLFQLARQYAAKIKDERLREFVLALVKAAEQIYGSGEGDKKRDYVTTMARASGLKLGSAELEAAVYELNKQQAVGPEKRQRGPRLLPKGA